MIDKTPKGIWAEFQRDQDYKGTMGFTKDWPEYTRFREGKQWPPATEKTKNMPRPVINQCDFTVENKQANILAQSLKIIFAPDEIPEAKEEADKVTESAKLFTEAEENVQADIGQDELNEDVVDDTLVLGTGHWHYYWDNNLSGGSITPYVGKLQGETIDPLDVCFGNPQLKASQTNKQPYIIIRTRTDTDQLKERAKKTGSDWEKIESDSNNDAQYDNEKNDLDKLYKTTTLIKYYRENGHIYWTEITRDAVVQKPISLAPAGAKPIDVYPVETLVFKDRKKCVYGRSFIGDMIPNQRMLNTGLGLMFLSIQQTAWPKILAKVGALTQSITNEPGEILTDHNAVQGYDGIKYMQPPNFSNFPVVMVDKLLELTRQVTGVSEVSTGEVLGANMAAAAIIALQNQAKKPNEGYQNRLLRAQKNIGRIHEAFFKSYMNLPRPVLSKNDKGKDITKSFTGTDYADTNFRLDISVTPRTTLDDSLQITMLDKFADRQWIDKYQYVNYAPKNTINQEMAHDFEEEQQKIEQQQKIQSNADDIINNLTAEEKAYLQQHPEILNQMGAQQTEQQPMVEQGGNINGM